MKNNIMTEAILKHVDCTRWLVFMIFTAALTIGLSLTVKLFTGAQIIPGSFYYIAIPVVFSTAREFELAKKDAFRS